MQKAEAATDEALLALRLDLTEEKRGNRREVPITQLTALSKLWLLTKLSKCLSELTVMVEHVLGGRLEGS